MFYTPLPEKKLNLKIDQKVQKSLHQSPPVDFTTTAPPGRPPSSPQYLIFGASLFKVHSLASSPEHPIFSFSLGAPPFRSTSISEPLNRYYTYTVHSSKSTHSSLGEALTIVRILSFTRSSLSILGGGITNNKKGKGGGAVTVRLRKKHTQAY